MRTETISGRPSAPKKAAIIAAPISRPTNEGITTVPPAIILRRVRKLEPESGYCQPKLTRPPSRGGCNRESLLLHVPAVSLILFAHVFENVAVRHKEIGVLDRERLGVRFRIVHRKLDI